MDGRGWDDWKVQGRCWFLSRRRTAQVLCSEGKEMPMSILLIWQTRCQIRIKGIVENV